ncbi:DUF4288 domain-containing protein [Nocardia altamirensis]|uniref:DUF4288 domain-containing protein n=1 Tax=Nocardia altamirensis TaxID=472158 RepID=UPI001C3F721C|nr:DUF4288 domain-containing protein [Nocardia altamirensis]
MSRTPYIAVILFESTSDAPDYVPMYQEDFVLLYAESEDAARKLAVAAAKEQECTYRNEQGENITLALKGIVDVNRSLTDDLSNGGDLYARHFRDYDAYRRMEPLLGDNPL